MSDNPTLSDSLLCFPEFQFEASDRHLPDFLVFFASRLSVFVLVSLFSWL